MFYVGNTFDEKANKGYKTIQNAKKAAEKDGLSVWDEEGVKPVSYTHLTLPTICSV